MKLEPQGKHIMQADRFYVHPGFSFAVNAQAGGSGIANILFSRDGKSFDKVKDGKIIFDKQGEFHLIVRAIDNVGNTAETNSYVMIVNSAVIMTN
jgi:hypothetical protein